MLPDYFFADRVRHHDEEILNLLKLKMCPAR